MFQFVLTLAIVVEMFLVGVLASFGDLTGLLPSLPGAAVIWWVWGLGVSASARADADGVHWRYFRSRSYSWSEINRFRFGGRLVKGTTGISHPAILVSVAGHEHPVTPAFGCGTRRLVEFGNQLIDLAAAHGVPVSVNTNDERWNGLRAA